MPGEPDVVVWPFEAQVQRTRSPGRISTDEGVKTRLPLGAIVTSTVLALAAFGRSKSKTAVATTKTKRQKDILIAAPRLTLQRINAGKMQSICRGLQFPKGNVAVTSDAGSPHLCWTVSPAVASSSRGGKGLCPRGGRWYSLRGEWCESVGARRVFS